jgi:hypothetical protein
LLTLDVRPAMRLSSPLSLILPPPMPAAMCSGSASIGKIRLSH